MVDFVEEYLMGTSAFCATCQEGSDIPSKLGFHFEIGSLFSDVKQTFHPVWIFLGKIISIWPNSIFGRDWQKMHTVLYLLSDILSDKRI